MSWRVGTRGEALSALANNMPPWTLIGANRVIAAGENHEGVGPSVAGRYDQDRAADRRRGFAPRREVESRAFRDPRKPERSESEERMGEWWSSRWSWDSTSGRRAFGPRSWIGPVGRWRSGSARSRRPTSDPPGPSRTRA